MDIYNSAQVKNRVKITSVLGALIVYGVIGQFGGIELLITCLVIMGVCFLVYNGIIQKAHDSAQSFRRLFPFNCFGIEHGTFTHVFEHDGDLQDDLRRSIGEALAATTPIQNLSPLAMTDEDKNLLNPETREYYTAASETTRRGSDVTLVVHSSEYGQMQSIQWWVLVGGYASRDLFFRMIAYSPFTIWFRLLALFKGEFDVVARIRVRYFAFFDDQDIKTRARCIHEAVFTGLVAELDRHGVDTSDLVEQRSQLINYNVSGKKVSFGDVIQGNFNKIVKQGITT